MVTPLELLDWADDLAAQHDGAKMEFCLLASLIDPLHANTLGLTFDNLHMEAQAAIFMPFTYSSQWSYDGSLEDLLDMERRWIDGALNGDPLPDLDETAPWWHIHPAICSHRVFWCTNFGNSPVNRSDIVDLLDALDPQTGEWANEMAMAKLWCGGAPGDLIAPTTELSWETYHEHLVYALALTVTGA